MIGKMRGFIVGIVGGVALTACSDSAVTEPDTLQDMPQGTIETTAFAQDGQLFKAKSGEEFSVRLKLPDGIKDSTVLWLPEEGGFGPHLKITRSYRSLEGGIYYTEHVFEGAEPGTTAITLAPKNGPNPVHEQRVTLNFEIE